MDKVFIDSDCGRVAALFDHKGGNSVVLLGHGYLSDKGSRTNAELSRMLGEGGISTISWDMYGHGESEGDAEHLTVTKALQNLSAVHDFAKGEGFAEIGATGSSFTGIVTLIAAAKRPFDAIALKCPVFDSTVLWDDRLGKKGIERWKAEGFIMPFGKRWGYEAYEEAGRYDMGKLVPLIKAPMLVVHGDKDITVPIWHAEQIISRASSADKRLIVVEGADHFFRNEAHFARMASAITDWLSEHLR